MALIIEQKLSEREVGKFKFTVERFFVNEKHQTTWIKAEISLPIFKSVEANISWQFKPTAYDIALFTSFYKYVNECDEFIDREVKTVSVKFKLEHKTKYRQVLKRFEELAVLAKLQTVEE